MTTFTCTTGFRLLINRWESVGIIARRHANLLTDALQSWKQMNVCDLFNQTLRAARSLMLPKLIFVFWNRHKYRHVQWCV